MWPTLSHPQSGSALTPERRHIERWPYRPVIAGQNAAFERPLLP